LVAAFIFKFAPLKVRDPFEVDHEKTIALLLGLLNQQGALAAEIVIEPGQTFVNRHATAVRCTTDSAPQETKIKCWLSSSFYGYNVNLSTGESFYGGECGPAQDQIRLLLRSGRCQELIPHAK
jgi:hypothetical protein